jgi:DNA-binding beta-propeller fold protein YncE
MLRGSRVAAAVPAGPVAAALVLAACGSGSAPAKPALQAAPAVTPERIMAAPRGLMAVAVPQANGITWGLAGTSSKGLYRLDGVTGPPAADSVSVSGSAQSLAESGTGVLGLALGSRRSGALELLDGRTARKMKTVDLPAPARQVVAGRDGTFYALTAWAKTASVSVINSRTGKRHGTVPVPADTVSIAPSPSRAALYVLQSSGLIDVIRIASGKISSSFPLGSQGISLAVSPDGSTLYALKGNQAVSNVAVVDVATQSVRRVLPSPAGCHQVLVSASGKQLYEVVGTDSYGNIQIFAS